MLVQAKRREMEKTKGPMSICVRPDADARPSDEEVDSNSLLVPGVFVMDPDSSLGNVMSNNGIVPTDHHHHQQQQVRATIVIVLVSCRWRAAPSSRWGSAA